MTEIWKELEQFPKYKFSNTGKVWSKIQKRELSLKPEEAGYVKVKLYTHEGNRIPVRVHRLIALTFIPNPENKKTVNHKNHNRADNRVENLEWATAAEQNNHKKTQSKEVSRLKNSRAVWRCSLDGQKIELYETALDAIKWVRENTEYKGCVKTAISAVCLNKRKTAYGYKWIYDTSEENIFENEVWKDIPKELIRGRLDYQISDKGRIKNPKGKFLKGFENNGYRRVSLGQSKYSIHLLVAQVFLPNFYNKPFVNHKDHDKSNCKLYNLEWVTPSENSIAAVKHYSSKKD
tara:strand:+ start:560 stop:1432 length:873 start_codon:yes stop_codon:yes gene_type:complete